MDSFYEQNKEVIDAYLAKLEAEHGPFEEIEEKDPYDGLTIEEIIHLEELNEIRGVIGNAVIKENRKAFIDEVIRATGLEEQKVREYITEANLEKYVEMDFSSKYVYDIYQKFPSTTVNDTEVVPGCKVDLYYDDFRIAIDVNCTYNKSIEHIHRRYIQEKTIKSSSNGVRLITLFDYELYHEESREKIYNLLADILSKPVLTIGARKTQVKVVDYATSRDFLNKYHVQGAATANIYLGCYYKDELIGIMTFGKPRFSDYYDYEIVRLAWKTGVRVSGGTQKIFKYFLEKYKPNNIMTYADINKFTGNGYLKLGFKFIKVTDPDYMWVLYDGSEALTRYKCQKHRLIQKGMGTKEQTEDMIMTSHGYHKVYGSGNIMLDWVKSRKTDIAEEKIDMTKDKKGKTTKNKTAVTINGFI